MHTAIVVIQMPEPLVHESFSSKWENYLAEVHSLRKPTTDPIDKQKGVARLGENVWQVNMQLNTNALARLVYFATQFGFPYGISPLDAAPQWLPGGFDPKTK
jgi:hypothetical protein